MPSLHRLALHRRRIKARGRRRQAPARRRVASAGGRRPGEAAPRRSPGCDTATFTAGVELAEGDQVVDPVLAAAQTFGGLRNVEPRRGGRSSRPFDSPTPNTSTASRARPWIAPSCSPAAGRPARRPPTSKPPAPATAPTGTSHATSSARKAKILIGSHDSPSA
jgi:hypothetical protein